MDSVFEKSVMYTHGVLGFKETRINTFRMYIDYRGQVRCSRCNGLGCASDEYCESDYPFSPNVPVWEDRFKTLTYLKLLRVKYADFAAVELGDRPKVSELIAWISANRNGQPLTRLINGSRVVARALPTDSSATPKVRILIDRNSTQTSAELLFSLDEDTVLM